MDKRSIQSKLNGAKGGRPFGKKNKVTIEKEKALEIFNNRVYSVVSNLFDSQLSLAKGQQFLFRIDTETDSQGKKTKQKPVLVENPDEIASYIESIECGTDLDSESYYYITTKEPVNQSIDSLMNRAFGRPKESVELSVGISLLVLDE